MPFISIRSRGLWDSVFSQENVKRELGDSKIVSPLEARRFEWKRASNLQFFGNSVGGGEGGMGCCREASCSFCLVLWAGEWLGSLSNFERGREGLENSTNATRRAFPSALRKSHRQKKYLFWGVSVIHSLSYPSYSLFVVVGVANGGRQVGHVVVDCGWSITTRSTVLSYDYTT